MLSGIHELELTQRLVEGEVTKITECTIVCNRLPLRPQGLRLPCRGGYSPIRFFREGGAVLAAPNALAWPPGRPNEALRRWPTLLEGAADVYHERTDGVENTR